MTFNDKIDKFMEDNNYKSLKQFANDCGIPYTTLKDFYDKKSADNSRLSTIRKLSETMKCTMDYLAFDDILNPNEVKANGLDLENDISKEKIYMIDSYNNNFDKFSSLLKQHEKELTNEDKELITLIINRRIEKKDKE